MMNQLKPVMTVYCTLKECSTLYAGECLTPLMKSV